MTSTSINEKLLSLTAELNTINQPHTFTLLVGDGLGEVVLMPVDGSELTLFPNPTYFLTRNGLDEFSAASSTQMYQLLIIYTLGIRAGLGI